MPITIMSCLLCPLRLLFFKTAHRISIVSQTRLLSCHPLNSLGLWHADCCLLVWRNSGLIGKASDGVERSPGRCGRGVLHRIITDGEHAAFNKLSTVSSTMTSAEIADQTNMTFSDNGRTARFGGGSPPGDDSFAAPTFWDWATRRTHGSRRFD